MNGYGWESRHEEVGKRKIRTNGRNRLDRRASLSVTIPTEPRCGRGHSPRLEHNHLIFCTDLTHWWPGTHIHTP